MEFVFIHPLIQLYQLTLVAKPGKIQFAKNALLTGYLMLTMSVFQFMLNVKLIKTEFATVAIEDMMFLMDHVSILHLTPLRQLMEDAKLGMSTIKDALNVLQDG
jgi:hypothetical protein